MTPNPLRARALAAALLDGPWQVAAMVERLRATTGLDKAWIGSIARAAAAAHADAPIGRFDDFVAWLSTRRAVEEALSERWNVRRWPTPANEMAESPWRVPALATTRELASWLGISVAALEALVHPLARHYRYTWVAKRHGHRLIEAPHPRLRAVQRAILDGIVAAVPPHDAVHGFRRGRSIATSASIHVGREAVIAVDLAAFFTSVTVSRVAAIFRSAGYPPPVAFALAQLCTHRTPREVIVAAPDREALRVGHLPQGAPTSGALANLAAFGLDVRVAALAAALGGQYTRYADDLVVSGDRRLVHTATTLVARVGAIAIEEGFALNFRKTRVMTRANRQRIVGLVVNDRLAVARTEIERLRAILHNCARTGTAAQNRDEHRDFRAHLLGRIAWVASIDPGKGARLRAQFDRIAWT